MIKKLRIKLILLTMMSVIFVLSILMISINVSNYVSTKNDIDRIIDRLIENGGNFDNEKFDDPFYRFNENDISKDIPKGMGRETAFETRFFIVNLYLIDDEVLDIANYNLANISIDEDEAYNLAIKIINKERGYEDDYRYRVITSNEIKFIDYEFKEVTSKSIYFVDAETRIEQLNTFRNLSILISISVIVFIFIVIFLLSKRIVKPISDAYERQKRFITNAAHELKTPLTIISANNEMLEISNGENELTEGINKQIIRMNNMVKNLSTLSKIDETSNVKRNEFNISFILDDMLESFNDSYEKNNKKIEKEIEQNLTYNGDEGLFRQLFSILLDNALKYSKSYLNVKSYQLGNKIIIIFKNDGYKIEEGNLNKYFERFYRSDETRASSLEGSGIGLSIAKEIVDLHKGEIIASGLGNDLFEIKIIL